MKLNVLIKGFTQIEILINLLIFSMIILGFYQLLIFQLSRQSRSEETLSKEEEVSFWANRFYRDIKESNLIEAKQGYLDLRTDSNRISYEFQTGSIIRNTIFGNDSLNIMASRLCVAKDSIGNICFVSISCKDSLGRSHDFSAIKAYSFSQLLRRTNSVSND